MNVAEAIEQWERSRPRMPRSPSVVLHDAGCTCEPDYYLIDISRLRVEHAPWCAVILAITPPDPDD